MSHVTQGVIAKFMGRVALAGGYSDHVFWIVPVLCCNVLQCVAMCCNVLQSVAKCCKVLQSVAKCCKVLQSVAKCCKVLR